MKKDFKNFINQNPHYFSEGHLEGWFKKQYLGKTKKEIKSLLSIDHDNSLEIENAESELNRELSNKEIDKLIRVFNQNVVSNIEFDNKVAVGYWNSLGDLTLIN